MNNELVERLTCECNNRIYKNIKSLKEHKKRDIHLNWVIKKQELEHRKTITRLQNQLEFLKIENSDLKNCIINLMKS